MKTIVVIPTYNEAENLPVLFDALFALQLPGLELLVVDDNSPDGTADLAHRLGQEQQRGVHVLCRAQKEGLGPAYVAGFEEALRLGAETVVQMDADMSHPPEVLPDLLNALERYQVVVASRYMPGGGASGDWGVLRRLISRGGDFYVRLVTGLKVQDTKSGFKAYRRESLQALPLRSIRSRGYIFQTEVLYLCQRLGLSMGEVPYTFEQRAAGHSKMSLGIMLEALWRAVQMRWRPPKPVGRPSNTNRN